MTTLAAVPNEPDTSEDDFLAFWQQHRPAEHKTILGVRVPIPTEIPLAVEDLMENLKGASSVDDVEPLVEMLFGPDVYQQWKTAGVTNQQLQVLFAWGMSNAAGKRIEFAEAAEMVAKAEAEGKAPMPANRAARRASSATAASGSTGRSSSRTSAASTASRRRK